MISFVSLFVGFVVGIVNVQLMATAEVDRVELFLDGQVVAELREPFSRPVDLGCEPAPHELVAVAYDERGRVLSSARQWVNRPRATADLSLLVDGGGDSSPRTARLVWRALAGEVPRSVTVTFDGAVLPAPDPQRIELPEHDPAHVHLLRADIDFGRGVVASAEMIVGGPSRVEARSELSAIPLSIEEGAALPAPEGLAGWLEAGGLPLEIAAVEDGPVDVVVVGERSVPEALKRFGRRSRRSRRSRSELPATAPAVPSEAPAPVALDVRLRFLWPVATIWTQSAMVANNFLASSSSDEARLDLAWLTARHGDWPNWSGTSERLADAVAVAALTAAEGNRRRAVVLVLGPSAKDDSLVTAEETARFLGRIGVPLHVWSISETPSPEASRWPAPRTIASAADLDDAVRDLTAAAARQRIVWVEGSHLPQDVELGPLAKGIRLAR
ncbi:MAG TPA: hypothetical protein PLP50_05805 [Thermoanaerobaculia bacterium]|nr:hypothetical protein [Thermoanaerobaculia bacterium]